MTSSSVRRRTSSSASTLLERHGSCGSLEIWADPFVALRVPKLFNLRTDPFERADTTSNTYWDWFLRKEYLVMAAQGLVGSFLESFQEYPPRQKAASFTIDQAMEKMEHSISGYGR